MGKRYYCDYCDKTMVATPSMIKMHNNGTVHQKLVNEHYQQYKDPAIILSEESRKKPCLKFSNGECRFGGICHYSHYSEEQLNELKQFVELRERKNLIPNMPSFEDLYNKLQTEKTVNPQANENTTIYDSNGITHVFPWVYCEVFDKLQENLPPSLKRFKIEDFHEATFSEWG
ncbi:unnamed protein product, partial [Iphiclides podalirius]